MVQIKNLYHRQNLPMMLLQCGFHPGELVLRDQRQSEPVKKRLHLFELDRCIIWKSSLLYV